MLIPHPHLGGYLLLASGLWTIAEGEIARPISIVIAVGVRLYREALAEILGQREDFNIAAVQAAEFEAVPRIVELKPDVVLLDMATDQSFAIGRDLHQGAPDVSVIGLGVGDSDAEMLACAEVGITGFVTPHASMDDLITVVKQVAQGDAIYSPQLAARLVRRLAALSADQQPEQPQVYLTGREREIAGLIEHHLSNKEIASTLSIEVATVKNHVHNILQKIGVRRRSEAVAFLTRERRTLGIASVKRGERVWS